MARTIVLKGRGIRKEAVAGGAVTPGHLVTINTSGNAVVHPTAGANARRLFAVENEVVGLGIDTAYAANDQLLIESCFPGMEINALVAASAAAIVIGDALESAGDGTLRKHTAKSINEGGATNHGAIYTDGIVAYAIQAVDNSGGGTPTRIKVEVA